MTAQSSTPTAADTAECNYDASVTGSLFELGLFHRIVEALEPCVDAGVGRERMIEILAFLVKSYLAMDELESAADAVSKLVSLSPTYRASTGDSTRFRELISGQQRASAKLVATSVSKSPESLREAPATVVVVSADEIERRGYLDLEAVLHDLPGFDLTRGSGVVYTNIYQRGYRSQNTDRVLFLVDGVEDNDVWSNTVYLSRQYPLSNIERLEVIYGPASTMYGANAFVGVINVITKPPESLLERGERFGLRAQTGTGSWNTTWTDVTVAGQSPGKNFSASLTARVYVSDEMDRSGFEDWDFDPALYDSFDYQTRLGVPAGTEPGDPLGTELLASGFFEVQDGAIMLNQAGALEAARRDRAGLGTTLEGNEIRFTDVTDVWSTSARVKLYDLELGFMAWQRAEGSNSWYIDNSRPGGENGHIWAPEQMFLYLRYSKDLGTKAGLTLFSRFKRHETGESRNNILFNYSNGRLDALDLARGTPALWRATRFAESSRQLRNEMTLVYRATTKLDLVGGLELRNALLQGNYLLTSTVVPAEGVPPAAEGRVEGLSRNDTGGQFFDQLDLGIFAQASYRASDSWKFVAGGRFDHNEVDAVGNLTFFDPETGGEVRPKGYGTVFNPRLAAIHIRPKAVYKLVYSEAFKDASSFNRYAISPGTRDVASPLLGPEEVRNLELSLDWQPTKELAFDLSVYRAEYSDAVSEAPVVLPDGSPTLQNKNVGAREIFGIQARSRLQLGRYDLWADFTYTDPQNVNPLDSEGSPLPDIAELRVGDIAEYQINLGVNAELWAGFNLNLRANYVGDRRPGLDGKIPPGGPLPALETIDAYTVVNGALTYTGSIEGLEVQLIVNNALDELYYAPGARTASGPFATRLPQSERSIFLRLGYSF